MSTIAASRCAFSALTAEGRHVSDGELLDAAMAYPRVAAPAWLDDLLTRPRRTDATASLEADQRVKRAAAVFLGLPDFPADRITLASSAGLALDRALATVVRPGSQVLATSPSIDIVSAMLRERGAGVRHISAQPPSFAFDVPALMRGVEQARPGALVLGSPENPTGASLDIAQLRALAAASAHYGTAIVADQCAATLRRDGPRAPLLAALDPTGLDWITIWDTGKSFGLGGEKLAFLFASRSLAARVQERVSLVEYEVPLRVRTLVADVLEDPRSRDYLRNLVALVERNRARLADVCAVHGLTAVPTTTSSLQLVLGQSDCVRRLRDNGVGVVPGRCFFHLGHEREPHAEACFRVALAREAEAFDEILRAIDAALGGGR